MISILDGTGVGAGVVVLVYVGDGVGDGVVPVVRIMSQYFSLFSNLPHTSPYVEILFPLLLNETDSSFGIIVDRARLGGGGRNEIVVQSTNNSAQTAG